MLNVNNDVILTIRRLFPYSLFNCSYGNLSYPKSGPQGRLKTNCGGSVKHSRTRLQSVAISQHGPATPTPSTSWQPPHTNTLTQASTSQDRSATRSSRMQPTPSTPPPTSRRRLPSTPRSGVTAFPVRKTLRRARRKCTLAPFNRATSEFVAIEHLRLRQEEKQNRQLYDLKTRRIEVDQERDQVLRKFADIAQAWFDHYRSKDNTEQLDSSSTTLHDASIPQRVRQRCNEHPHFANYVTSPM